jgi:hypothetical protein
MITDAIHKEMQKALRRGWDKIYVFVDFHEVILVPDYQSDTPDVVYYPGAMELLRYLTYREDICLVTWTCSHPHQTEGYLHRMAEDGIHFNYVNENPEVSSDRKYGFYEQKPYYNIVLDDKAGVMPHELPAILEAFKQYHLGKPPGECRQCQNPWEDGFCSCS